MSTIRKFWAAITRQVLPPRIPFDESPVRHSIATMLIASGLSTPQIDVIFNGCRDRYNTGQTDDRILESAKGLVRYVLKQQPAQHVVNEKPKASAKDDNFGYYTIHCKSKTRHHQHQKRGTKPNMRIIE